MIADMEPADPGIAELLHRRAIEVPDAQAILCPGRAALTYAELWQRTQRVADDLRWRGVTPATRVAIVLPNGPEMAVAFLGVASGAVCAPLNPAYRAAELRFYLEDTRAEVLILDGNDSGPARAVANEMGLQVVEFDQMFSPGRAQPSAQARSHAAATGVARSGAQHDVALILHTSGTTARPKIVPLTHANLTRSAASIAAHLALQPRDRCLNVMPLFHIHGMVGALLASLHAGSSIVCTSGFDADAFFDWVQQFQPSWYTAVPTIHQTIVANGDAYRRKAPAHRFRFIRSSSSALPPSVARQLEEMTGAPVIEAYGMTEASHQMTSNPLPPGLRKPGSVGVAAGADIAIMDEAGRLLAPGETGEIVIRGPGVTSGYENNPQANAQAWTDGWFRTGDQGRIDGDDYLFISGRLKEIVNRGGEKVSPREIDEALLEHPDVAQAVAFAVPHRTLGEDLVAAVVLRAGCGAAETDLRLFLLSKLAAFKVPSRVIFVDAIPKGPTGKVQRTTLHEKLGEFLKRPDPVELGSDAERLIAGVWTELLGVDPIGPDDNFFSLGGHSLLATQAIARIEKLTGTRLEPRRFVFESLAQLAWGLGTPSGGQSRTKGAPVRRLLKALRRR